ncbi:hypothetical protein ACIG3E_22610 [Streptomyces sp. NPDC053474]|uniref:hypothetical protein n=1 Tax=Streptomyces sp. NPDC053474 TaxID=3365704 RepID=UPI0037D8E06F
MSSVYAPVYVPEGSFGVLDHGEVPAHTADWSNGLVAVMRTGVLIATGIRTGPVRVRAISCAPPPPGLDEADQSWEEITEVTVQAPHAGLRVEHLHDGAVDDLPLLSAQGPGPYRLRVFARGRDIARGKVRHEPTEDYLLSARVEVFRPARAPDSRPSRALRASGGGLNNLSDSARWIASHPRERRRFGVALIRGAGSEALPANTSQEGPTKARDPDQYRSST